jgi:ABC-type arginine transport system ATPase subunit
LIILRHQAFGLGQRQALFDRTLNTHQANAELVLGHLTDATDTTVTEVVDVIDVPLPLRISIGSSAHRRCQHIRRRVFRRHIAMPKYVVVQ